LLILRNKFPVIPGRTRLVRKAFRRVAANSVVSAIWTLCTTRATIRHVGRAAELASCARCKCWRWRRCWRVCAVRVGSSCIIASVSYSPESTIRADVGVNVLVHRANNCIASSVLTRQAIAIVCCTRLACRTNVVFNVFVCPAKYCCRGSRGRGTCAHAAQKWAHQANLILQCWKFRKAAVLMQCCFCVSAKIVVINTVARRPGRLDRCRC